LPFKMGKLTEMGTEIISVKVLDRNAEKSSLHLLAQVSSLIDK